MLVRVDGRSIRVKKKKKANLRVSKIIRIRLYGVSFVGFSLSSALMRERDELAAALEVRERIKYDLATPEREEVLSTGDLIIEVTMRLTIVYRTRLFSSAEFRERMCMFNVCVNARPVTHCSYFIYALQASLSLGPCDKKIRYSGNPRLEAAY